MGQKLRGEGMAQAVAAGLDASGLGIPLHLFLHAFGRQCTMRALLIPEHHLCGHCSGPYGQARAEGRQRNIRRYRA